MLRRRCWMPLEILIIEYTTDINNTEIFDCFYMCDENVMFEKKGVHVLRKIIGLVFEKENGTCIKTQWYSIFNV